MFAICNDNSSVSIWYDSGEDFFRKLWVLKKLLSNKHAATLTTISGKILLVEQQAGQPLLVGSLYSVRSLTIRHCQVYWEGRHSSWDIELPFSFNLAVFYYRITSKLGQASIIDSSDIGSRKGIIQVGKAIPKLDWLISCLFFLVSSVGWGHLHVEVHGNIILCTV